MAPQRLPELFCSNYSGFELLLPLRIRGSNGISSTLLQAQVQAQVQPSSKRSNAGTAGSSGSSSESLSLNPFMTMTFLWHPLAIPLRGLPKDDSFTTVILSSGLVFLLIEYKHEAQCCHFLLVLFLSRRGLCEAYIHNQRRTSKPASFYLYLGLQEPHLFYCLSKTLVVWCLKGHCHALDE